MALCDYRRSIARRAFQALGGDPTLNLNESQATEYSGLLLTIMHDKNIHALEEGVIALARAYTSSGQWSRTYDRYCDLRREGLL
jgi:hypothetical protein